MALSNDEKELLRKAICDGAFGDQPQQPGRPVQLTADKLAEISAMDDAGVRTVLRAYQVNKAAALQQAITRTQTRVTAALDEMTALQGVAIEG